MAKPTTYATPICILLSIIAIIGIIAGIADKSALWVIFLLLPAVIYEVYRTEGETTKWASWLLLALLIAEIIFVLFNIKFDLANFVGQDYTYVGATNIPLGDLTIVFPTVMAVLSVILFIRTAGVYTKWLSVIIFASMIATVYIINPNSFRDLIRSVFNLVMWQI